MSFSKTVLALCTGNSCRTQMAEVWFNNPHGEALESFVAVRDDIRTPRVDAVRIKLDLQP